MTRKITRIIFSVFALLITLGLIAYSQILGFTRSTQVKPGVHLIYNTSGFAHIGANIVALDAGDSWVVFDTHLGPLAAAAIRKIKSLNAAPIELAFVSHWHPDHSGGISAFKSEAKIVAHENVAKILSVPHEGYGLTKPGAVLKFGPVRPAGLPELLLSENQTFTVNQDHFEAVHYPSAHTNGDIALFDHERKIAALGDLVWPGGYPFIDTGNGGTAKGVDIAIKDILARTSGEYVFIPGHGEPLTRNEVAAYSAMVEESIGYVEGRKVGGDSLEAIQTNGMPEALKSWATALVPEEEWIRMIFLSL